MRDFHPDALVLGCTHYPILRDVIQQTVGEDVKLVDSGEATADEVVTLLRSKGLENPNEVSGSRELCDDMDHFLCDRCRRTFRTRRLKDFSEPRQSKLKALELYGGDELRKN
jgi:glutamate racemase